MDSLAVNFIPMQTISLYLPLPSNQWRVVSMLSYFRVIAFLGTLGSTCSLVHSSASPIIWTVSSSREPHITPYYALFSMLHKEDEVLLALGE
jgi:hypothetical protein